MPQVINFSFPTIFPEELENVTAIYADVREMHKEHDGWLSTTVWKDCNQQDGYAVATQYQSEDAATSALKMLTEEGMVDKIINAMQVPPVIKRMVIEHRFGGSLESTAVGHFMSLSFRRAEPGFAQDLEDELLTIFESLQYIEGFIGSAFGANPQVTEEVLGMVLWRSKMAFEDSLPEKATYEVRLFERVF